MRIKFLYIIILAATLSACAVSDDPRQGGFLGGLHGLSTGAYDTRIQERQEALSSHEKANQLLQEQSKALGKEVVIRDKTLSEEKQNLAKMEGDLSRLDSEVGQLKVKSDKQKAELAQLKRKIEDHRRSLDSQQVALNDLDQAGGKVANPARYVAIEHERDRLAEEHKRLLEYWQALADAAK